MDSRIKRRKNKSGAVAWPRRSSATPRRRGSPRHSRNFSGGVSGPPRLRDLRLGGALRLGVHSYA